MIKPIRDGLVRLLEFATASLMGILVLDVTWQVASRFILRKPSAWTEELATILMIWASLLGAALAYAKKMHLGVDYFVGLLSDARRALVALYVHLLVAGFAGYIMVYGGLRIVMRTLAVQQMSPALGIDRGYIYLALPIGGLFILLFAVEAIAEEIRTLRKGEKLP